MVTPEHWKHARVPCDYWKVLLKNIPDTMQYKKMVKAYLVNFEEFKKKGVGLYLWSTENSTGKTALAVLCMKRCMELGYSAFFITSEDFKEAQINREMFDSDMSVYERAISVDLLVLDDIAKEYRPSNKDGMGFAESQVQKLLRVRTQNRKPIILTSNKSPKELESIYGVDVKEMLRASIRAINIKGINWRDSKEADIRKMFEELGN